MKPKFPIPLTIAAVSIALLYPQIARARNPAQDAVNSQAPSPASDSAVPTDAAANPDVAQQAMQMVPAQARLVESIDARKMQAGQEFQATLSDTVHLKNGPELPHGTKLVGTISTDTAQAGRPTLALRFTKAELKDGKVVPITAVILGIAPPPDDPPSTPPLEAENIWKVAPLQIDNIGVVSGVDLHSQVGAANSGVLVATTKDNVKLSTGSQLALAIAAQPGGEQGQTGGQ
jgi:hypothetical protein